MSLKNNINDSNLTMILEKIINYLKILKQNGYRILRLVNNILDSTKFDNKHDTLEMHNYNIISVVEDIVYLQQII